MLVGAQPAALRQGSTGRGHWDRTGVSSPALTRPRAARARASLTTDLLSFVSLNERSFHSLSLIETAQSPLLCRRQHHLPPTVQTRGPLPWDCRTQDSSAASRRGHSHLLLHRTKVRGKRPSEQVAMKSLKAPRLAPGKGKRKGVPGGLSR